MEPRSRISAVALPGVSGEGSMPGIESLPPEDSAGYQGEEFTVQLQSPTREGLDEQIASFRKFAKDRGLETFKVLERGKDPDGGYRAIITAHNWNPFEAAGRVVRYTRRKYARGRWGKEGEEKIEEARLERKVEEEGGRAPRRRRRRRRRVGRGRTRLPKFFG